MFRAFIPAIALVGAIAAAPQPVLAQSDYPNRVVKVVVPYGPGTAPDILARALATSMSNRLGQQFVVENRTGGSGAIGTASVARAEPDGYTLLFTPALVLSVLPQARGGSEAGYKPDSLAPVCQTFVNTMGLAVRPDSPLKSVADLMAAAKQRPGQLNYGHPGVLTIPHLAMEELQQAAGADTKDIPFRTGPQSVTELLGGRLDFVSLVMGTEVGQNIRIIAVFGEKRIATFPDVPTVKEQGYDVAPVSFGGLLVPPSTPEPVQSRLRAACREAAKDEIYATTAKRAGQPDDLYLDASEFRQRLQGDIASKARVLSRLKTP
jgi:tripartite-type tricarboxylate transporter receptor subunit TctC